jgi:hypothetical protein
MPKLPKGRGRKHIDKLIASGHATPVTKKDAKIAAGTHKPTKVKGKAAEIAKALVNKNRPKN